MKTPDTPADESARLDTLRSLQILDTAPEERFDRLTRLAKRVFDVPIALVSLIDRDRQWFKSKVGLDACETSRDISFCGHAILDDTVFVVPNAESDPRFADNPLVTGPPGIRFYAGCPLMMADGSKVGTLCIIDRRPRELSAEDQGLLEDLARIVERELSVVQLATTDDLTGLHNRRGFETLGTQALRLCRRVDGPASLLYFDLNGFKTVNDRFGHAAGDQVLTWFAQDIQETFRESDVLGRLGGDEFVVLATNIDAPNTDELLVRLRNAVALHDGVLDPDHRIAFSVGVAHFRPEEHADIGELLHEADELMYQDKGKQRD